MAVLRSVEIIIEAGGIVVAGSWRGNDPHRADSA